MIVEQSPLARGGIKNKYIMYGKIKYLAELNRNAKTQEEKDYVKAEMLRLQEENPQEYESALKSLIKETAKEVEELTMAEKLGEVTKIVSMSYLAKKYFGKTRSWLAQRLNENTVNGKRSKFTDSEIETMRYALADISKTIGSISVTL